jgi:hypothetical protein
MAVMMSHRDPVREVDDPRAQLVAAWQDSACQQTMLRRYPSWV